MAPEMIVQQIYDHRVDLWGLGLIVYEMMVGKHPFLEWADVSTCDSVTDAMTKLLSAIALCRGPGSNTTEIAMPRDLPFQFMIGEDSPVRVMQGLLQESPEMRWSYRKLSGVLRVTNSTLSSSGSHQAEKNSAGHNPCSELATLNERGSVETPGSSAQRRRSTLRRNSASQPDNAVRWLLEKTPISEVPLGRDQLVVMYSDDSCLEALRVLLHHKISSAPVLRG